MPTKCYFFPEEDAIYECSMCGKPICDKAMRFNEDNEVVCPACTLEKAVDIADDDVRNYMEQRHRAASERSQTASRLEKILETVNGWYLVTVLVLAILHVLLLGYVERVGVPATFDPSMFKIDNDPAVEVTFILSRLFRFADEHKGAFPERLDRLYPDYLDHPPRVLGSDEVYNYSAIVGDDEFVLSLDRANRYSYRTLFVTGDGIIRIDK